MKGIISLTVILCVALLALTLTAAAQGPGLMNYQGYLTDEGGDPLTGDYTMTFKIYDDPTGPNVIWTEPSQVVTVTEGLFQIILGESTSITDDVFSDDERWLEIVVEGEEITPRTRLVTAPYAFRVSTVDGATGGIISGNVTIQEDLTLEGTGPIMALNTTSGNPGFRFNEDGSSKWTLGYAPGGDHLFLWNYYTGAGAMVIDDTTGNVGLGTSNPIARLHVYKNSAGVALYLSGADKDITWPVGQHLQLGTWDGADFSEKMRLTGSGLIMKSSSGTETVFIDAEEFSGEGANINLNNASGINTVEIDAQYGTQQGGHIRMATASGTRTVEIDAEEETTGGSIKLSDSGGNTTIELDAEWGEGGGGWVITQALQITGGADLSEQFEIRGNQANSLPSPGMVVSIDPGRPGELMVSAKPYDPAVAGIISGAGDVNPGMLMGQSGSMADGHYPVALTGRVYCWVDASHGAIKPGDLLTTPNTPGHAMKATDRDRAYGAVIGKAMTGLEEGKGLVLVLVNLQ